MSEETQDVTEQFSQLANDNEQLILENHAMREVLNKHKVDTDNVFTQEKLSALSLQDDGSIAGEFGYDMPKAETSPRRTVRVDTGSQTSALTREDFKTMSPQEINDRWDEVKTFLKGSK